MVNRTRKDALTVSVFMYKRLSKSSIKPRNRLDLCCTVQRHRAVIADGTYTYTVFAQVAVSLFGWHDLLRG